MYLGIVVGPVEWSILTNRPNDKNLQTHFQVLGELPNCLKPKHIVLVISPYLWNLTLFSEFDHSLKFCRHFPYFSKSDAIFENWSYFPLILPLFLQIWPYFSKYYHIFRNMTLFFETWPYFRIWPNFSKYDSISANMTLFLEIWLYSRKLTLFAKFGHIFCFNLISFWEFFHFWNLARFKPIFL